MHACQLFYLSTIQHFRTFYTSILACLGCTWTYFGLLYLFGKHILGILTNDSKTVYNVSVVPKSIMYSAKTMNSFTFSKALTVASKCS